MLRRSWPLLAAAAVVLALAPARATGAPSGAEVPAAWFALAIEAVRDAGLPPTQASRVFASAGITLYESALPGLPGYRSLAGQLHGLDRLAAVAPPAARYDGPAAANAALARVLRRSFAGRTELVSRIDALEAHFRDARRGRIDRASASASASFGRATADAIAEWAEGDGRALWAGCESRPPLGRGLWVSTPPAHATALEPCWGRMRLLALRSLDDCRIDPPAYSEEPGSDFHREAQEVASAVASGGAAGEAIARFWADEPGRTATPAGHWIAIASELLVEREASLALAAETYARLGIALADAVVVCWHTKYEVNLVRPVTYIRAHIDPAFRPLLATPPFPEFPSGHSVLSSAAAEVLTELFGELPFTDRTQIRLGLAPRPFDSPRDAAEEAALSRLHAGIHFRAAIERGLAQGRCVGRAVAERVSCRR